MYWIPACAGMTYVLDSRLRGNDLCTGFPPARERLMRGSWGLMGPSIYACRLVLFLLDFQLSFAALHFSLSIFGKGLCPWLGRIVAISLIQFDTRLTSPWTIPCLCAVRNASARSITHWTACLVAVVRALVGPLGRVLECIWKRRR